MDDRRADDGRINKLMLDVNTLQVQMQENTEVTVQVRDILGSFRTLASLAKWVSAIGGGIAAGFAVVKGWGGG